MNPVGEEIFQDEGSTAKTKPTFITHKKSLSLVRAWEFRFFNERWCDFDLSSRQKCEAVLNSNQPGAIGAHFLRFDRSGRLQG